ncbi:MULTISPECIES: hypothetical protein [Methanobacterium]|jgi:hypothetical protein|nr:MULTISPECIES: hypothetical protein [Methanobacterium]
MPKCSECKFYEPLDDGEKGKCFGNEVPGDMDADNCPVKAFRPK